MEENSHEAGTKCEAEGVPRSKAVLMARSAAVPILRGSGFTGLVSKHHFVAGVALDFSHECVLKEWVHTTKQGGTTYSNSLLCNASRYSPTQVPVTTRNFIIKGRWLKNNLSYTFTSRFL